MSSLDKPLDAWEAADVLALIDEQIDEGQRLDYKRELSLANEASKREAAKDASGMANATGGLLIYGVGEKKLDDGRRAPARATPLTDGGLEDHLRDVLLSAIAPKLNLVTRTLETDGGFFLLVKLMQRSGPLHMVEAYGESRYYMRSGTTTLRMKAHEVDAAFRQLAARDDLVEARVRALPIIARLFRSRSDDEGKLDGHGRPVEPHHTPWTSVTIAALDAADPLLTMQPAARRHDFMIDRKADLELIGEPPEVRDQMFDLDAHGYLDEHRDEIGILHSRTRLYRPGIFEWGARWGPRREGHTVIPGKPLVWGIHDALSYFAWVYTQAGYYSRLRVWVRIDNADRATLIGPRGSHHDQDMHESIPFVAESNVEELRSSCIPLSRGAANVMFQGFGFGHCPYFDDAGELQIE